jgi:hypothetical protein
MKNQHIPVIIALCLILIFSGCSRIYDPVLENTKDVFVVEALMTDDLETYSVKLSLTSPFNSSALRIPVSGARVWVIDNSNRSFHLYSETGNGYYTYTPIAGTTGVVGHPYTLHIETSEGDNYESSPEVMPSHSLVDSVYVIRKEKTELIESSGDGSVLYGIKNYVDVISDIRNISLSTPRVRFEPNWIFEMIDRHTEVIGGPPPPPTYRWIYTRNNLLSISDDINSQILKEQYAGSLLVDNFPGLYEEQHLVYLLLVMNYYYLTDDSYRFHYDMKKQLSADDALFDPISIQIEGNIKCLNDPERPVIGMFDVTSHEIALFFVNPNNKNSPPTIKPVGNLHGLPTEAEGNTEGTPPYWWLEY